MTTLSLSGVPTQLLIDGAWVDGSNNVPITVTNPATGEAIVQIANANAEDGRRAAAAANRVQSSFAAMPTQARSRILLNAYALLLENRDDLAAVMTAEMGKPLAEALGEIEYSAGYLQWYAQEALRVQGSHGQTPNGRGQILLTREPVGVSLLITPWNFPLAMGARKIAPAIATGCAIIVKPAEKTPLTMLFLARLLQEAGLPAGALNVVTTSSSSKLTAPILEDGLVRHLSFTGSTEVGSLLHGQCSKHMIRTSLELGGNAPFIIFEDADIDQAVNEALAAKMRNMGEACTAANRILVHESIAEDFARRLTQRFSQLRVGNGLDDGIDVGPMIDRASCDHLQALVDDAVAGGARLRVGGTTLEGPGSFFAPTVLTDVPRSARMSREELFGPVAPIYSFAEEEDAVAFANDTEYGLAAYLITKDLALAMRISSRLEVGMVGINSGIVSDVAAPLGGIKSSGLGREGGILGIDEFLEYKYSFFPHE